MQVELGRIDQAEFKLATKREIRNENGGILWRLVTLPWTITCKVAGTWHLVSNGPNALKWDEPLPQKWTRKAAVWLGYQSNEELAMRHIYSFFGNRHLIDESSVVAKAFFKHTRNGELFDNSFSMCKLLAIIREIFPEEEFSEEDFMMTCTENSTKLYHTILGRLLSGKKITDFKPKLSEIIEETFSEWAEERIVNVTVKARIFSSRVILELMFGNSYETPQLAAAVDFLNNYIIKFLLRKLTDEDNEEYKRVKVIFRDAANAILEKEDLPIFDGQELTLAQRKALIILIFFAGQETVAALLTYMIRALALDEELQAEISEDASAIERFFLRSIKEFPPAYGVGRKLKEDVCLEYEIDGEVRKKVFFKGELVVIRIMQIASSTSSLNYKSWMPFGGGPHRCPGEKLAYQEITQFIQKLVSEYKVTTDQLEEIEKVGLITTKLAEDIKIILTSK